MQLEARLGGLCDHRTGVDDFVRSLFFIRRSSVQLDGVRLQEVIGDNGWVAMATGKDDYLAAVVRSLPVRVDASTDEASPATDQGANVLLLSTSMRGGPSSTLRSASKLYCLSSQVSHLRAQLGGLNSFIRRLLMPHVGHFCRDMSPISLSRCQHFGDVLLYPPFCAALWK